MIFCVIYGVYFFRETFPHVVKFGITRNSYFVSLFIYVLLFSIIMTTISQLFIKMIDSIIEIFNIENFTFRGIDLGMVDHIEQWELILYEGLIYILLFLLTILMASIFFRFGLKIGFTCLLIFPFLFVSKDIAMKVFDTLEYVFIGSENYQPFYFLIPYLALALLLYLITKKLSVVDQVSNK